MKKGHTINSTDKKSAKVSVSVVAVTWLTITLSSAHNEFGYTSTQLSRYNEHPLTVISFFFS